MPKNIMYTVKYPNDITLNKINNIILDENQIDYLNLIFNSLRKPNLDSKCFKCFTDDYSTIFSKHTSEFMNGNYHCDKNTNVYTRKNVSTLKEWAKILSDEKSYLAFYDDCKKYVSDLSDKQINSLISLFESDKDKMPSVFKNSIFEAFEYKDYSQAVALLNLWAIYGEDKIELLSDIYAPSKLHSAPVLKDNRLSPGSVFLGRESILDDINEKFKLSSFVFLQGIGGIGKSECAKQYAKKYNSDYNIVVFAECNTSLMDLINDNTVLTLTSPFVSHKTKKSDGTLENDLDYYNRKLSQLKSSANSKTLIILDNIDHQDEHLCNFLTGFCKVIVTTRCNMKEEYPEQTIIVDEIKNMDTCKKIFSKYYGKDVLNDENVEDIIRYFSGHTMAMEIAAKQMKASNCTAKELLEIIKSHKKDSLEEGFCTTYNNSRESNMFVHIQQLFRVAELNKEAIYILKCLSVLPKKGMDKALFKEFCNLKNYTSINNLVKRSWIREINGILSVHALIKEVIFISYSPDLYNCQDFINQMMNKFSSVKFYNANISDKSYMFEYISHIYELFPEPDIKLYEFYEWIELIMSHYGKAEVALNISKKLHKLYVNEYGSPNFRTARMLCRIGCSEKNMLIKENLEHLNEGLKMLNEIENLSYHEKLYISDVHVVLINSYMLEYDKSKDTKFLNLAQKSCEEIIKIRSVYKKNYNSFRMSLISAYCCLSRIEIISGNYQEADKFIKKAEKEYESNKISSLKFYIEYAKVELLIAQNKIDEVIDLLKNILSNQKSYFNSKQSDSGVDIIKLGILLGDLYNKKGESKLAKIYYNDMLELARDTPYYDEILIKLQ